MKFTHLGLGMMLLAGAARLATASPSAFQDPHLAPPTDPHTVARALSSQTLLFDLDGRPCALGPAYRAIFSTHGLEFTPQMAPDSAAQYFHYALDSIRVGQVALEGLDLLAAPDLAATRVEYARGAGVTERYEPFLDGLEQSFLFEHLPARDGDLVVSGRISTGMLPDRVSVQTDVIELGDPAQGGVRLSKVLGIDADGRTQPG